MYHRLRFTSPLFFTSKRYRLACAGMLSCALAVSSAQAVLIASESFQATAAGTGGTYDADTNLGSSPNLSVVTGNYGFSSSTGKLWGNVTAGVVANLAGVSHPLLTGTAQSGSARVGNLSANISRRVYRPFAATPPVASTYYFSGLVNLPAQTSLNGVSQSMAGLTSSTGTTVDSFNIASGIHYGLIKNSANEIWLSAAAGNTVYPLVLVTGTNVTFQVVLKLDVNTTGNESLSAWYAPSSDSELSIGLSSVDVGNIYGSPLSIGALLLQTRNQSNNNNSGRTVLFDEIRFGTEWADVTTAAVPEPAQAAVLCGVGAALWALRRRRR